MKVSSMNDYLNSKNLKIDELSKEECFRAGQIQTINDFANALGMSLTFNGLNWVDEIYNTYLIKPNHETRRSGLLDKIDMTKVNFELNGVKY